MPGPPPPPLHPDPCAVGSPAAPSPGPLPTGCPAPHVPLDDHLLLEGDPVRLVRAAAELPAEAIRDMLIAPSLLATLDLLGVSESDRSELLGAIPRAVGDPALLEAVTEVVALLRAAAWPGAEPPDLRPRREHDDALQQAVVPGQGLVAILAVGRLHVEIMRDESLPAPGWTAGIHIPEIGPLVLAEVEASLRAAVELLGRTFGDLGDGFGHRFRCRSWLLGPSIREATAPESNLAAFASLWSEEEVYDATEEAVYFVFRRRPPVAWQDLPTRTSLETAVVEHLRTHRPWRGALGRLER